MKIDYDSVQKYDVLRQERSQRVDIPKWMDMEGCYKKGNVHTTKTVSVRGTIYVEDGETKEVKEYGIVIHKGRELAVIRYLNSWYAIAEKK